jgi:hypothetical protein
MKMTARLKMPNCHEKPMGVKTTIRAGPIKTRNLVRGSGNLVPITAVQSQV